MICTIVGKHKAMFITCRGSIFGQCEMVYKMAGSGLIMVLRPSLFPLVIQGP